VGSVDRGIGKSNVNPISVIVNEKAVAVGVGDPLTL